MKATLSFFLTLVLISCASHTRVESHYSQAPVPMFVKYVSTVVRVSDGSGWGSGVAVLQVRGSTLVLTANHVLTNATGTCTVYKDKVPHLGEIVLRDRVLDLAIVAVKGWGELELPTCAETVEKYSEAYTVGYPVVKSLQIHRGFVTDTPGVGQFNIVSIPVNFGCSGAPVFSANGQIVGLISRANIRENWAWVALCVKPEILSKFIGEAADAIKRVEAERE